MNTILITVILLATLALSFWLVKKGFDLLNDITFLIGASLLAISTLLLWTHIVKLLLVSYTYKQFEVKRDAFETTINNARESGNQMEAATILRDVVEWNAELASLKYDNTTFVFGIYIDDRIDALEPIK